MHFCLFAVMSFILLWFLWQLVMLPELDFQSNFQISFWMPESGLNSPSWKVVKGFVGQQRFISEELKVE